MKKKSLISVLFAIFLISCNSIPEGTGFDEPNDPNPISLELWENAESGFQVAFGSTDWRYEYHYPPETAGIKNWTGSGWRGEILNLQLKLWSKEPVQGIRINATSLFSQSDDEIAKENISIFPVRYVLTDEFLTGCGWRDRDTIPAYIAADMLDYNRVFNLDENTLRPVWLTIEIPEDSAPGLYEGHVQISYRGGKRIELPINLKVYDLVLPPPSEWSFHLDLWQNPFAVARFYDVEPWSDEHWEILPPYLEMLAKAGQKCITASILHRPWGGQTFDHFESMIEWKHLGNGVWEFDYSVFDRWVEMAMDAGITRQINCYSMVPWGNQVRYFDADSTDFVTVTLQPGSDEYAKIWSPFLKSFRNHLKEKGWLDKTMIAMDERGIDEMRNMVALIKDVAPEFRIAYAGNYLEELSLALDDLCVHIIPELEKDIISARTKEGLITTFYTMCAKPEHPNNFTFSPPAEQAWLGWHASARGFTGFLRWAYNSWVEDPLMDSRFRTWPAGDTYQIYPGPRSSIRFERLREGIQDYEKIRILRQFAAETGQEERLRELDKVLEKFNVQEIQETPADYWLNKGKAELDILSKWAEN